MQDESHGGESRVRELVELVVKGLLDRPEEVEVLEEVGQRSIVVRVRASSDEIGKVIGRGGRIANSLRLLAKAAATKVNKSVWVDIAKREQEETVAAKEEQT